MHLVTYPVARPGVVHTAPRRDRLQIQMVVVIFRAELRHIVVNVTDGKLRFDRPGTHTLIEQKCSRPRSILSQRLVNPDTYGITAGQFAVNDMNEYTQIGNS